VRGFPVESDLLFVLLCSALGEPAVTADGGLIDHVTPREGLPAELASGSKSRAELPPHSESSASRRPPGALMLGCLVNDAVGGDTTVIEVDTRVRAILEAGLSAAVELLTDACFPTVNVPRRHGHEVVLTVSSNAIRVATSTRGFAANSCSRR
jgi:hypothetical protein